jgi:DNA-binding MurR/RpiR family transcriptional regulator
MPLDTVDLTSRLERHQARFSPAQRALARYVLRHLGEIPMMSAHEVAREAHCSPATVVRFAQALGYEGYPDLQRSLPGGAPNLTALRGSDPVGAAARRLAAGRPVVAAGEGHARAAIVLIEEGLSRIGVPVVGLTERSPRARAWLSALPRGAAVLAIAQRGESTLAEAAARAARAAGAPCVAVGAASWPQGTFQVPIDPNNAGEDGTATFGVAASLVRAVTVEASPPAAVGA